MKRLTIIMVLLSITIFCFTGCKDKYKSDKPKSGYGEVKFQIDLKDVYKELPEKFQKDFTIFVILKYVGDTDKDLTHVNATGETYTCYLKEGRYAIDSCTELNFGAKIKTESEDIVVKEGSTATVDFSITNMKEVKAEIKKTQPSREIMETDLNSGLVQMYGYMVQFPIKVSDFQSISGWYLKSHEMLLDNAEDELVQPYRSNSYIVKVSDKANIDTFTAIIYNPSGEKVKVSDCLVIGFQADNNHYILLPKGISTKNSLNDAVAAYGEQKETKGNKFLSKFSLSEKDKIKYIWGIQGVEAYLNLTQYFGKDRGIQTIYYEYYK